ncbi:ABI-1-like 1 [Hibiscus trionum]|uniref:ABI-1-like 1 n=1 Tax=Hibiscus trionum TaxID=183268 RepID=A0A9W7LSF3_HIBTR|nr:ABI-1-like 1 [Hibiscus trionum]
MEAELTRPDYPLMTFDEVSMESRKSFVKALQELKNLRPQLYSAAKYSEKSFHHSELKQIVLENLKDYAAKALVNTVDHLGTVANKLTDLLEQQSLEVSSMELKASCLNQQLFICQTYSDKEGLRQHQLLAFVPRHHKHYTLPDSVNKKLFSNQHVQTNPRQIYFQAESLLQPSDTPASKPLSWHLASETNSTLNGTSQTFASNEIPEPPGNASMLFQLSEGSKPSTAFRLRSFDNQKRENIRAPVRGKKAVSAFFGKQKAKLKALHILHEHESRLQKGN